MPSIFFKTFHPSWCLLCTSCSRMYSHSLARSLTYSTARHCCLLARYRMLIYSGDTDACVPYWGTEEWTRELGYPVRRGWRQWHAQHLSRPGLQRAGCVISADTITTTLQLCPSSPEITSASRLTLNAKTTRITLKAHPINQPIDRLTHQHVCALYQLFG
jgi:hypothetical protein